MQKREEIREAYQDRAYYDAPFKDNEEDLVPTMFTL
jgi:hypothetical protein